MTQKENTIPRSGTRGFQNMSNARQAPQDSNRGSASVKTEAEVQDKKLPFDYVATAVNFIISNMHRPDPMRECYLQNAPTWFEHHRLKGHRITHEECNVLQDDLLAYLKGKLGYVSPRASTIEAHA